MTETSGTSFVLPASDEITSILDLENVLPRQEMLDPALLNPLAEFFSVGGKGLRTQIIEAGFHFGNGAPHRRWKRQLARCTQIIEGLHAGAMIVDDIQDLSQIRRGQPTLHRRYGLPIALNAGNWLYFWALDQIRYLGLKPRSERELQRYFHRTLLRAHFGQAMDVGTPVAFLPQEEVLSVCLASMELKTGALMSLAFDLGAFLGGQEKLPSSGALCFARRFGVALQMFDDIGNFLSPPPKGKEDLRNGRPSFVWAMAAQLGTPSDYERFIHATRMLPDESFLVSWSELFDLIPQARKYASTYLWKTWSGFKCKKELQKKLELLCAKLESSYEV